MEEHELPLAQPIVKPYSVYNSYDDHVCISISGNLHNFLESKFNDKDDFKLTEHHQFHLITSHKTIFMNRKTFETHNSLSSVYTRPGSKFRFGSGHMSSTAAFGYMEAADINFGAGIIFYDNEISDNREQTGIFSVATPRGPLRFIYEYRFKNMYRNIRENKTINILYSDQNSIGFHTTACTYINSETLVIKNSPPDIIYKGNVMVSVLGYIYGDEQKPLDLPKNTNTCIIYKIVEATKVTYNIKHAFAIGFGIPKSVEISYYYPCDKDILLDKFNNLLKLPPNVERKGHYIISKMPEETELVSGSNRNVIIYGGLRKQVNVIINKCITFEKAYIDSTIIYENIHTIYPFTNIKTKYDFSQQVKSKFVIDDLEGDTIHITIPEEKNKKFAIVCIDKDRTNLSASIIDEYEKFLIYENIQPNGQHISSKDFEKPSIFATGMNLRIYECKKLDTNCPNVYAFRVDDLDAVDKVIEGTQNSNFIQISDLP